VIKCFGTLMLVATMRAYATYFWIADDDIREASVGFIEGGVTKQQSMLFDRLSTSDTVDHKADQ
jgi:hypothetical protein